MKYSQAALLILSVLLAILQSPLYAQTPAAEEDDVKIVDDEIIQLQMEMAENGYSINKSLESKSRLLAIYEKLVYARCMEEVRNSLTFSGPTTDKACIKYSNKILALDAGNVVAFCVLQGVDSPACRIASERQKIAIYEPDKEEKKGTASIDDVVESKKEGPRIRQETLKLMEQYDRIAYAKETKEIAAQKKSIFNQILDLNCAKTRVRLEKMIKETSLATTREKAPSMVASDSDSDGLAKASPTPDDRNDPFAQMMKEHFKTPTPAVVLPESVRIYERTAECDRYIGNAFKLNPNFAQAQCYKWGVYSWQCINAKRIEYKANIPKGTDNFTRPTGIIQSF